jgi:hypothetical protein
MRRTPTKEELLSILRAELPHLRQTYGVTRVALYGSFARQEAMPHSDVDLLVELSRPLGLEFIALALYLEKRLGRKVDLATFDDLRRSLSLPHRRAVAQQIERSLNDVADAA